jgi:hypothetical protein
LNLFGETFLNICEWAKTEFEDINLGDKRLSNRLVKIVNQFISSPESPINKACRKWGDTKAAYRFFNNESVKYADIIDHHVDKTKKRLENEEVILAIQDTSYYNYTSHPKTTGLGLLSRFKGKYKKDILTTGLYMHTTMAVNVDGTPLGLLNQKIVSREVLPEEKIEIKKRTHNNALPIEEKESIRWLNAMRKMTSKFSDNHKKRKIVTVADREADIYDLFLLAEELDTNYLIRASHNRKINKTAIHSDSSGEYLWNYMSKKKIEGEIQVEVPAKGNQPKRIAKCDVKLGRINILPSRHYKGDKSKIRRLNVYVIQVVEKKPPQGSDKIDWMLYTNTEVNNYGDAIERIKWYCLRWRIEVYFKVIKSGFNAEECRLATADRLIRYLAVVSIVAWRVYWLTLAPRVSPHAPVSDILSEEEWKVLFVTFNPINKIPKKPPSTRKVITWIAQLGGFLARYNDGHPGVTHVWRGLQKLSDMTSGLHVYQKIYG